MSGISKMITTTRSTEPATRDWSQELEEIKKEMEVERSLFQQSIDRARRIGELLAGIKSSLPTQGAWTDWRDENLTDMMSKETCNRYIRLYEHWDDDRIQEARDRGVTSVIGLLEVIQLPRTTKPRPKRKILTPKQKEEQRYREVMNDIYDLYVRELTAEEVEYWSSLPVSVMRLLFGHYIHLLKYACAHDLFTEDIEQLIQEEEQQFCEDREAWRTREQRPSYSRKKLI
jgi:hypothetical protein